MANELTIYQSVIDDVKGFPDVEIVNACVHNLASASIEEGGEKE